MKSQSPHYQNQPVCKGGEHRQPSGSNRKVIRLHEVRLPGNQVKNKKKASMVYHSGKSDHQKDNGAIAKALFDKIVHCLNQNNFLKAEQLRERLRVEAPTAVREIVRSGEIIEQKKTSCMRPSKIRPWADLFNQFNNSEAVAFYFALRDFVVKPNQPVFQQGSCDNRLYFIRSGRLKLKYFDYDIRKNVSITELKKGDIAGVETFFTLTNHTTNLIAVEESEISYLEKSAYQRLVAENHAIESKLCKYCETKQIRYDQSHVKPPARRAHKRYATDLTGKVCRLDKNGKLSEEILEVKIIDLSAGGLAYRVRNLKIGEAAHLHNSRIHISASYRKYSLSYELKKSAKVVSLKFLPFGECTVHVQFEEAIDEDRVIEIARHTSVTAYI